jgi:hypothetical protein
MNTILYHDQPYSWESHAEKLLIYKEGTLYYNRKCGNPTDDEVIKIIKRKEKREDWDHQFNLYCGIKIEAKILLDEIEESVEKKLINLRNIEEMAAEAIIYLTRNSK